MTNFAFQQHWKYGQTRHKTFETLACKRERAKILDIRFAASFAIYYFNECFPPKNTFRTFNTFLFISEKRHDRSFVRSKVSKLRPQFETPEHSQFLIEIVVCTIVVPTISVTRFCIVNAIPKIQFVHHKHYYLPSTYYDHLLKTFQPRCDEFIKFKETITCNQAIILNV